MESLPSEVIEFRSVSPEVAEVELRLRLPGLLKALKRLEDAKRVPRETMELEFVV